MTFFFGDSRVFGDLAFGDSLFFFGDLVDFAFAALAFFGDVASFLVGLVVVVFLAVEEVDVDGFFVMVFLGDLVVDFLGADLLVGVIDVFFELDVDLFLGDEGTVNPEEVVVLVVVEVEDFLAVDFFFFFLSLDGVISLYEAFTL